MQKNPISFDYETGGTNYALNRQSDPRISAQILEALGPAKKVLNVGAGAGSYEPSDRMVVAVEPSKTMRAQRAPHLAPAVVASAENLPFDDHSFDASMAILTVHHWENQQGGLAEMRRVTTGPVVIMTFDVQAPTEFWIGDYVPEMQEVDQKRFPSLQFITQSLGGRCDVIPVPVHRDCRDKIQSALYWRPEELLLKEVRKSQSIWGVLPAGVEDRFVQQLSADLQSGKWDQKYGIFRTKPFLNGQLRLVIGHPC